MSNKQVASIPITAAASALPVKTPRAATLLVLILIQVGFAWASGDAALAQEARGITFEEAVQIAVEQNTDLKRAQTDVLLRDAIVSRERMDFLPELQLSASSSRNFGRSFSQEEGAILSETRDFVGTDVSAGVDLFSGFEKFASLRQARLEEDASALRLARTRQDVVFQVIEGFTVLLQNQQLAAVAEQELETQGELLRQVDALVRVGRRPVSDLYQQQAVRAEAEAALIEARRLTELARTQLILVLQLDPLGTYAFEAPAPTDSLGPELADEDTEFDLERLLEIAFARRADLEALETDIAASQQSVRVARSGYWPTLSLSFGYGSDWSSSALQPIPGTGSEPRVITVTPDGGGEPVTLPVPGTGIDPDFQRPSFWDQFDGRRGGSVRLFLSIPVFDRLQTRTSVRQARAALLDARYELQDQRQQVALQVRQAVLDYRSARAQVRAAQERLQAAQQAREAAVRRYDLGAATFVELAQVNALYVAARSALIRARYEVLFTRKLIGYYTGDLDPAAPLYDVSPGILESR